MRSIAFTQAKGGQGTSTVAATVAIMAALNVRVLLVTEDVREMLALLGTSIWPGDSEHVIDVNSTLTVCSYDAFDWNMAADLAVFDNPGTEVMFDRGYLVTRACYLALAKAARTSRGWDGIVLVNEPGRALRANDVADALGSRVVAEVDYDPAIARAIDAGLMIQRLPRALVRMADTLVVPA